MAAILNGIAYHGSGLILYGGTFLVFADYMRGSMRLSALSELGVIYVLTHDSIGAVKTVPPTSRSKPSPCAPCPGCWCSDLGDVNETSGAYKLAIENRKRPSALCLSRQGMANQANSSIEKAKGGYILEDRDGTPDLILIGTGTELDLCVQAAKQLSAAGKNVRVVSMPCVELFDEQSDAYKEEVLPNAVRKRMVVGKRRNFFGWHRFIGLDGDSATMNRLAPLPPAAPASRSSVSPWRTLWRRPRHCWVDQTLIPPMSTPCRRRGSFCCPKNPALRCEEPDRSCQLVRRKSIRLVELHSRQFSGTLGSQSLLETFQILIGDLGLHRAMLGPAHRAKLRLLVNISRQRFIVIPLARSDPRTVQTAYSSRSCNELGSVHHHDRGTGAMTRAISAAWAAIL